MATEIDVAVLAKSLEGRVLTPLDPAFDEARALWNGAIDRTPAVIARCTSAADVAEAIAFARRNDLTIAVHSGGHNVAGAGTVDDGLVIDLSPMREVRVDPDAAVAIVAGGATLGDLDGATQAHGLATSMGVVSETGVAGLTLTGGMGWMRRRTGLSCDELLSAQVVTADGSIVTASEDENPDLFWGLRGGGGNFGVVTEFRFRLHPVGPDVAVAFTMYPAAKAEAVYRACADYVVNAPEEISPLAFLGRVPAEEAFPPEAHGQPFAAVAAVHTGTDLTQGTLEVRPLRELDEPIVDLSDTMPYTAAQSLLDEEYPQGRRYYWKSIELTELSREAIAQLARSADAAPSDLSTVDIWYQGGAMSRVAPDATAFGDRSAPILIGVEANWEGSENDEANIAWARRCVDDLAPFSGGGTYLNFPGFYEEKEEQLRAAYGANYERLVQVKTTWDPDNVFRINQNIPPAQGPPRDS